uniref:Uncharacterized protein n=1 Tax=Aegilops tauschii subsp. strangulata TaxID=200361 RepID=A0A453C0Q1_AEGTS
MVLAPRSWNLQQLFPLQLKFGCHLLKDMLLFLMRRCCKTRRCQRTWQWCGCECARERCKENARVIVVR